MIVLMMKGRKSMVKWFTLIVYFILILWPPLFAIETNKTREEEQQEFCRSDKAKNFDLHLLASFNCTDQVKVMLEKGVNPNLEDNVGRTPLISAILYNNFKTIKLLLDYGADPEYPCSKLNCTNPIKFVLMFGKLEVLQIFEEYGVDLKEPRHQKNCAINSVVISGNVATVEYLRLKGWDIHARDNCYPVLGSETVSMLKYMISLGEDPLIRDEVGNNLLHYTSWMGKIDVVKEIIAMGEDVNYAGYNGITALMVAANYHELEIVKVLINAGADPSIKDKDGKTALDYAKEKGYQEIIDYLESLNRK